MEETRPSFEHQEEQIIQKSYLKQILFGILLLIAFLGFYFLQNKFILPPYFIIPQNYSMPNTTTTTTTALLPKRNQFSISNTIRCIVYVKARAGRLGNRMFMLASAYGLARLHSCHLYLTPDFLQDVRQFFVPDFSSLLLSSTTFNLMMMNQSTPWSKVQKDVQCQYVLELTRPNGISKGQLYELIGFWQSYLHFSKYTDELRQNIFISTTPILEKVSHFFLDIYQQNFHIKPQLLSHHHQLFKQQLTTFNQTVWIGIHIRRRDFVGLRFSSSDDYVFTAIKYFTEHYSNAHFIVASDDKAYCRNLFRNRSNVFITPDSFSIGEDMITLSLCEHSIITGGTFGWWVAYLANGEVVHDKTYPSGCEKREQYYPPWFLIDGYVRAHKNSNYTL